VTRFEVRVPAQGDSGESSYLTEWLADIGQQVTAGEPLLVLETNKAEFQVESPVTGILAERLAQADDEVAIGAIIAIIETG
jgi:pyruvate/2-oxoglutarate dehydrogenase complex dihydrolipoamide acyltransferase (E2) component